MLAGEDVGAVQGSAGDGMAESLGLRLCGGWCGEGSLGFSGGGCRREQVNLLRDCPAKIVE